jgi:hypothetical protein
MQTSAARCGAPAGLRQRDASRGAGLRVAAPCGSAGRSSRLAVAAKLTKDGPHVCIVGTTGAVGQEFLSVREAGAAAGIPVCQGSPPAASHAAGPQVIAGRNFPYSKLTLLGSSRCAPAPQRAPPLSGGRAWSSACGERRR